MGSKFDSVWVPTLQGAFLTKYEGVLNQQWSTPITKRYDSSGEFLKLVDLGTVGSVRQLTGGREYTSPNIYTSTIQNLPFELTMMIDVDDVRRDKIGMFETKAAEMGAKFADHVNRLVIANLTNNPTCFDGAAFFSASHPVNGTVQKNLLTASEVGSLDVVTAAAPTAVEMANAILDVVSYTYTLTDESGDPINGAAKEFLILTSNPKIYSAAIAAIMSLQLSQGVTNPLFAGLEAKGYKFLADLDPRIGSSTSAVFYVFRTDSEVKPFAWSEESGLEINYQGEGSYPALKDNAFIWGAKAVRQVGVGRYQHAFKATLS